MPLTTSKPGNRAMLAHLTLFIEITDFGALQEAGGFHRENCGQFIRESYK
jgi:hypothetical protein